VDDELKADAAKKLANFGLTLSDAIPYLLTRINQRRRLTFGLTVDQKNMMPGFAIR